MFMIFLSLLVVASVPLCGGQLSRLSQVRFAGLAPLVLALALQVLITEVIVSASRALLVTVHLASYGLAGYAVWANRRLPGLVILGAGALTNGLVIALNGGTLPASAHALRAAGFPVDEAHFANSGVLRHPVLPWLGDIAATPSWLPFRNVISVGDILVLVGAAVFVHGVARSRLWSVGRRALGQRSRSHITEHC